MGETVSECDYNFQFSSELMIQYRFYEIHLQLILITMNPESQQDINEDIISSLSSNERYAYVYSNTRAQMEAAPQKDFGHPSILVYKNNDELTVKQLVSKFVEQTDHKYLKKIQSFQLYNGLALKPQNTIKYIKKILRQTSIDGIKLYPYVHKSIFANECCLLNVLESQKNFNNGKIEINFQLKPLNYSIYLKINGQQSAEHVKKLLAKQISSRFRKEVNPQNINVIVDEEDQKVQMQDCHVIALSSEDKIQVYIKNSPIVSLPNENKSFLVVKGKNIQSKTFQYEAIKTKKVIDILNIIKPSEEWKECGLKIDDFILKSHDKIQKCQALFEKSVINTKHLTAVILKEYHIFNLQKSNIQKVKKFQMNDVVDSQQKNCTYRQKCERLIQQRANETNNQYFKGNFKNVEPIFLYTSQLKVKASSSSRVSSIFRVVNQFLRSQNFASTSQIDYKKWQYHFQCHLLNQLTKLPPINNKQLWRGVGYKPTHQIGDSVLYKQFTSTTSRESVAKGFASQAIFKITKSKSSRNIKEYSIFKSEDEYLFPSYVSFKVTNKYEIQNDKKGNKKIMCFQMQEEQAQPLPVHIVNFILWVDDKTTEGRNMWANFKQFENTTIMAQLLSTAELRNWLECHNDLLSDQTAHIAMISNMTRRQNGIQNGLAGVDAIEIFRENVKNGNIFLYIGNRKVALQKLQKRGIFPSERLRVSSIPNELKGFLKDNIQIK